MTTSVFWTATKIGYPALGEVKISSGLDGRDIEGTKNSQQHHQSADENHEATQVRESSEGKDRALYKTIEATGQFQLEKKT